MTPETLALISGSVVALIFEYFPVLHTKYNEKPDNQQKLIMLAVLVGVAFGVYGLSCAGFYEGLVCDGDGAKMVITALVMAIIGNQSTHRILPS